VQIRAVIEAVVGAEAQNDANPSCTSIARTTRDVEAVVDLDNYKLTYNPPELAAVDAQWCVTAKRKKNLDRSALVMKVAARSEGTAEPAVLQLYPLRTTDHALRTGKAPGVCVHGFQRSSTLLWNC
jgi:hypothetical protein